MAGLIEHDDVIPPPLTGAPHVDLALGPAPARVGPDDETGSTLHHPLRESTFVS